MIDHNPLHILIYTRSPLPHKGDSHSTRKKYVIAKMMYSTQPLIDLYCSTTSKHVTTQAPTHTTQRYSTHFKT